jgi:hypothetical protein
MAAKSRLDLDSDPRSIIGTDSGLEQTMARLGEYMSAISASRSAPRAAHAN